MTIADSDVLIEFLRGRDPMAGRVESLLAAGRLSTTVVNAFELLSGAREEEEEEVLEKLLGGMEILALTEEAARGAARIRRDLDREGLGVPMADCLIAGVCLAAGRPLLTGNRKHFERMPGLSLA